MSKHHTDGGQSEWNLLCLLEFIGQTLSPTRRVSMIKPSLGTRQFALRGMVWFHCNIAFVLDV